MTLYFACPAVQQPSGGVAKIFEFVSALERAGVDAAVVHPSGSQPVGEWFQAPATRFNADEVSLNVSTDVLVVPEIWAFDVELPPDADVVVLNQGAYLTFPGVLPESATSLSSLDRGAYAHPGLLAVVCVSADTERYLHFTFPDLNILRVHLGVDTETFFPGDAWREPALACMPRRRTAEISELLRILGSRGAARWPLRVIDGLDHRGVAAALRASPIFLNFPVREGFPLPALEAMASGCIVIGYTGRGGDEYLVPGCAFPIAEGDSIEFARVTEQVIHEYDKRSSRLAAISEAASVLVRNEYTLARQDREVVEAFSSLVRHDRERTRAGRSTVPMHSMLAPVTAPTPSRVRVAAHHARAAMQAMTRRSSDGR